MVSMAKRRSLSDVPKRKDSLNTILELLFFGGKGAVEKFT